MKRAIICAVIVAVSALLILPFSTSAITPIRLDTPYAYVDASRLPFDESIDSYVAFVDAFINNVTFENEQNDTGAVFDVTDTNFVAIGGANNLNDTYVALTGTMSAISYVPGITQFPTLFTDVPIIMFFAGGDPDYRSAFVTIVVDDGSGNYLYYAYDMPSNLTLTLTDYDPETEDVLRKILLAFSTQGDITLKEYTEYIFGGVTDIYGVFIRKTAEIVTKPNIIMSLSFTTLAVVLILACFALLYRLFRKGG